MFLDNPTQTRPTDCKIILVHIHTIPYQTNYIDTSASVPQILDLNLDASFNSLHMGKQLLLTFQILSNTHDVRALP